MSVRVRVRVSPEETRHVPRADEKHPCLGRWVKARRDVASGPVTRESPSRRVWAGREAQGSPLKNPCLAAVNRLRWRGEGDWLSLRVPMDREQGQRDGR